jgi:hypothetical protein
MLSYRYAEFRGIGRNASKTYGPNVLIAKKSAFFS